MYKGKIPFDIRTGRFQNWARPCYAWDYQGKRYDTWHEIEELFGTKAVYDAERVDLGPDWRPNAPFKAKLELVSYSRGRSAANFDLKDEQGQEYSVFLTDMLDILLEHSIVKGWTEELTWSFCKRGTNYGLKLHDKQL